MDIATLASENEVDEAPSAISMLELSEMLSARTYLADKAPGSEPSTKLVAECREDWNRLNASLCSERRPTEGALVVARGPAVEKKPTAGPFVGFAIVERAETVEGAEECAVDAARQMSRLLATDLQFASFEPVCERERLESVVAFVESSSGVELRRRTVRMEVTDGNDPHGESKIGFVRSGEDARESTDEEDEDVEVLCPWKPSIDPWVRLFESLESEPGTAGLVVRFRGLDVAPEEARLRAGRELARAERLKEEYGGQSAGSTVSTGRLQRAIERTDEFVSALDGSVMAQRVSVVRAEGEVSDALVQTVGSSIDQHTGGFESETAPLAGGFEEQTIESVDLFGELSVRGPRDLFSPRAAGAALRLPMPPRGGCTTGLNVRRGSTPRRIRPRTAPVSISVAPVPWRRTTSIWVTKTGFATPTWSARLALGNRHSWDGWHCRTSAAAEE
ncbi:MAG: hypothetical protein ABEL76_10865 [Bradymonadaceae bacterium]